MERKFSDAQCGGDDTNEEEKIEEKFYVVRKESGAMFQSVRECKEYQYQGEKKGREKKTAFKENMVESGDLNLMITVNRDSEVRKFFRKTSKKEKKRIEENKTRRKKNAKKKKKKEKNDFMPVSENHGGNSELLHTKKVPNCAWYSQSYKSWTNLIQTINLE